MSGRGAWTGRACLGGLAACAALAACGHRSEGSTRPAAADAADRLAGPTSSPRRPFEAEDLGTGSLVRLVLEPPDGGTVGHLLVLRREDAFPDGPDDRDAAVVHRGPFRASIFDSGVTAGRTYFYAAFLGDATARPPVERRTRVHVGVLPVTDLQVTDPGLGGRLTLTWHEPDPAGVDFVRVLRFAGACQDAPDAAGAERRIDLPPGAPGGPRSWTDDAVRDEVDSCYAVFVRSGIHYSSGAFASGRSTDVTPPAALSGFSATSDPRPGRTGIELSWENPPDPDLAGVVVLRRDDVPPERPDDPEAVVVCRTRAEGCRDPAAPDGVEHFYRAWAFDEVPLVSRPADARAVRPFVDDDGDLFREDQGDCNDADGWVHPGALSLDCSATDWDCDGAGWDDAFCARAAPPDLDDQCARRASTPDCIEGWGCDWGVQPDGTPCRLATRPDFSYDICVAGACRSPGSCGSARCNAPGPRDRLPPAAGNDALVRTGTRQPVVTDGITHLVWQGCPAGLSGADCSTGDRLEATYAEALVWCDRLVWAGHDDWRLPSPTELLSIIDYGRSGPAVDPAVFPATSDYFWSSSLYAAGSMVGWVVHFAAGHQSYSDGGQRHGVRCVRGGAPGAPAAGTPWRRFRRDEPEPGQPVVLDAATALVWQGCAAGRTGRDCDTGAATLDTWDQAASDCASLVWAGFDDWRLPDVKELASLLDTRVRSPAIDAVAFPGTPVGWYWSSTPWVFDPPSVWQVNFSSGHVSPADKPFPANWRCVRGGR